MLYHKKTPTILTGNTLHLLKKPVQILATNACTLKCGGCTQHCDIFKPKEKWFIPIPQLQFNIEILTKSNRMRPKIIGIFGGEPTIHPKFKEIIEVLSSYKQKFYIFTNGINCKAKLPKNTHWVIDHKTKFTNKIFHATLFAPKDVYKFKNKMRYWHLAKKHCYMWHGCWSIIYDNKAYLCEPAAALDRLKLGIKNWNKSSGWKLTLGENPLDKSSKEIAMQAANFCYRCGCYCERYQNSNRPSIISPTNYDLIYHNPITFL